MIIEYEETGSGLSFYTEAEKQLSIETGWILPESELQERMDESFAEWLVSEERLGLIQRTRIDPIIEKYPQIVFDVESMAEVANHIEAVREKFDNLRELNLALEQTTINSYDLSAKGRNVHYSLLLTFMYEYVNALSPKYRATELTLIKELASVFNKEFGNYTGIQDIPRLFMEGATKPITHVIKLATKAGTDILSSSVKAITSSLGLDTKKIIIGVGIAITAIIIGLIGYVYSKSYIQEKGTQKARG